MNDKEQVKRKRIRIVLPEIMVDWLGVLVENMEFDRNQIILAALLNFFRQNKLWPPDEPEPEQEQRSEVEQIKAEVLKRIEENTSRQIRQAEIIQQAQEPEMMAVWQNIMRSLDGIN